MSNESKGIVMGLISSLLAMLVGCSREDTSVLAELEAIPKGLEVVHSPDVVENPVGPNPSPDWKYRWIFRTEVRAIDKPLTITKFGILAWDGSRWILPPDQTSYNTGVLDAKTFIEWYQCPNAIVSPGRPAIDPQNWAGSHSRQSFKQKWFFIGVDANGKSYKGEGVVELRVR